MDDYDAIHLKPYEELDFALERLTLFRNLLDASPINKLCVLLEEMTCDSIEPHNITWAYHELVSALLHMQVPRVTGDNWKDFILQVVLEVENLFSAAAAMGERDDMVFEAMRGDLRILQTLFLLDDVRLRSWCREVSMLDTRDWARYSSSTRSAFEETPMGHMRRLLVQSEDWASLIEDLWRFFREMGSGIFIQCRTFLYANGALTTMADVRWPRSEALAGYGGQKRAMEDNLRRFSQGMTSSDLLLIGESGSGRWTLMMAAASQLSIALVKVDPAALGDLAALFDRLRRQPKRFLLYVEELSEGVQPLLTTIENCVITRPANVLIAASLPPAALTTGWWGMIVRFDTPDEDLYTEMVRCQLMMRGRSVNEDVLVRATEEWARENGRTGRSASRCAEWLAEHGEAARET